MQTTVTRETRTANGQGQVERVVETGTLNGQGQVERVVETVNYYSSPGQGLSQKPTQVIHQNQVTESNSNTSGGVLTNAAASVASTLESAKRALSRK